MIESSVRPISRLFGVVRHDGPTVSVEEMDPAWKNS